MVETTPSNTKPTTTISEASSAGTKLWTSQAPGLTAVPSRPMSRELKTPKTTATNAFSRKSTAKMKKVRIKNSGSFRRLALHQEDLLSTRLLRLTECKKRLITSDHSSRNSLMQIWWCNQISSESGLAIRSTNGSRLTASRLPRMTKPWGARMLLTVSIWIH